jgi:mRNA interferase HigB
MRVIAVKTLRQFGKKKKDAEQSLQTWNQEACKAHWKNHNELKEQFRTASVISDKRVVFNIHGNKYRLVVDIEYRLQIIFIVWAGSHAEYDKIDVKKIAYVKTN